ncbi:MAG: hypothetical protein R2847_12450 [Bacteroidia bacterium]
MVERAQTTFILQACRLPPLPKKAEVKKLIIGHFSARYKELHPLLDEARTVFPNTELAIEGNRFEVE